MLPLRLPALLRNLRSGHSGAGEYLRKDERDRVSDSHKTQSTVDSNARRLNHASFRSKPHVAPMGPRETWSPPADHQGR